MKGQKLMKISYKKISLIIFVLIIILFSIRTIANYRVVTYLEATFNTKNIKIIESKLFCRNYEYNMLLQYPLDDNTTKSIEVNSTYLGDIKDFHESVIASEKLKNYIIENITLISSEATCDEKKDNDSYQYKANYVVKLNIPEVYYKYLNKNKYDTGLYNILFNTYFYSPYTGEIQLFNEDYSSIPPKNNPCILIATLSLWTQSADEKESFLDAINDSESKIIIKHKDKQKLIPLV